MSRDKRVAEGRVSAGAYSRFRTTRMWWLRVFPLVLLLSLSGSNMSSARDLTGTRFSPDDSKGLIVTMVGGSARPRLEQPTGLIAFEGTADFMTRIYLVRPDGTGLRSVTGNVSSAGMEWSPDGELLVFDQGIGPSDSELRFLRRSGKLDRVIVDIGDAEAPAWSESGEHLAFSNFDSDIVVFRLDGTGRRTITTSGPRCEDVFPTWGKSWTIAFIRDCSSGDGSGIYLRSARVRTPRLLVPLHESGQGVAFHPDRTRLAYAPWTRNAKPGIYIVDIGGGSPVRLTNEPDVMPSWSPDGEYIAFIREGRMMILDLDSGQVREVPGLNDLLVTDVAWG